MTEAVGQAAQGEGRDSRSRHYAPPYLPVPTVPPYGALDRPLHTLLLLPITPACRFNTSHFQASNRQSELPPLLAIEQLS